MPRIFPSKMRLSPPRVEWIRFWKTKFLYASRTKGWEWEAEVCCRHTPNESMMTLALRRERLRQWHTVPCTVLYRIVYKYSMSRTNRIVDESCTQVMNSNRVNTKRSPPSDDAVDPDCCELLSIIRCIQIFSCQICLYFVVRHATQRNNRSLHKIQQTVIFATSWTTCTTIGACTSY